MKALSMWQPWASLLGAYKFYETRSWGSLYRGPVAIHAAKRVSAEDREICENNIWIKLALRHMGETYESLPRGSIIALAYLDQCIPYSEGMFGTNPPNLRQQELAMGNFGIGRVAWRFSAVHRIVMPIGLKGQQGLWDLGDSSAEIVERAAKERLEYVEL